MIKLGRTTKYLIGICAFLLVVNSLLGYVLTKQSDEAIRDQIESRMLDVANTAAALLDGDVLESLQAEDTDTPEYQEVLRMLSSYKENIELEYIYCVRDMGNRNFVFMIDPDPEAPGLFGEHIAYTDALYQASLGVPAVDQQPYQDEWGRFYSAYSPVFDSRHKVAGIVAVDFSADWYEKKISRLVNTTIGITAVSILLAAGLMLLVARKYRERIRRIYQEMNGVSAGIETLVKEITPGADTGSWHEEITLDGDDDIEGLSKRIHFLEERLSEQISFVRSQTYVDGLTGTGNRIAYEDHVEKLKEAMEQGTAAFTIAVFDLNGLKEINDNYGHEKGDEAIIAASKLLERVYHDGKLYRIGGDEFVVIMNGSHPDILSIIYTMASGKDYASMSMGAAVYDPETDKDYRAVFARADQAMYDDKRSYYRAHRDRRMH